MRKALGKGPGFYARQKFFLWSILWDIVSTQRTHVALPSSLVEDVNAPVGARGRSAFIAEATERAVRRQRLLAAIDFAAGAWKEKDHPELKSGSSVWVEKVRREGSSRLREQQRKWRAK